MGACLNLARCRGIAAEASPTVTLTLMLTVGRSDSVPDDRERCFPINPPQCSEEPAGTTLGAGSRRRGQRVEKARRGPAREGRPFPLRQEVESETSTRSPTRARRAIDKRPLFAALPFRVAAGVAPRVVPAGSYDVARRAKSDAKGEPAPKTRKTSHPNIATQ